MEKKCFVDKFDYVVCITEEYTKKLKTEKVPPMGLEELEQILLDPDDVRVSTSRPNHRCYYKKGEKRYRKVTVKYIKDADEHWVVTGHSVDGIKESEVFDESKL